MERLKEIPEDFLIQSDLSDNMVKQLLEQINRFYEIQSSIEPKINFELDKNGKVMLKKGTLVHGIGLVNPEKIKSISETGILTGQAIGIPEDQETYYCADFFKVTKDEPMEELNNEIKDNQGRTPFNSNQFKNQKYLAFIIEPREEIEELLKYDCYLDDTEESEIAKKFVNEKGLPLTKETGSSILYGVPSQAITGIVIGSEILEPKIMSFLIKLFPNCYISSNTGEIAYNPKINKSYDDLVAAKCEIIRLQTEVVKAKQDSERLNKALKRTSESKDSILNYFLTTLSTEMALQAVKDNKLYQGTDEQIIKYIEELKNNQNGRTLN